MHTPQPEAIEISEVILSQPGLLEEQEGEGLDIGNDGESPQQDEDLDLGISRRLRKEEVQGPDAAERRERAEPQQQTGPDRRLLALLAGAMYLFVEEIFKAPLRGPVRWAGNDLGDGRLLTSAPKAREQAKEEEAQQGNQGTDQPVIAKFHDATDRLEYKRITS